MSRQLSNDWRFRLIFVSCIFFINESLGVCARPVDYVAPVNPCRLVDRFCSTRCELWQMRGEITCDFCVCTNKSDYVRWETTPASTLSPLPTSPLPPDTIIVNSIQYHRVADPCQMSRDRMCPSTCAETKSHDRSGASCTMCDCHGAAVIIG